jgi:hypothetical protein
VEKENLYFEKEGFLKRLCIFAGPKDKFGGWYMPVIRKSRKPHRGAPYFTKRASLGSVSPVEE